MANLHLTERNIAILLANSIEGSLKQAIIYEVEKALKDNINKIVEGMVKDVIARVDAIHNVGLAETIYHIKVDIVNADTK